MHHASYGVGGDEACIRSLQFVDLDIAWKKHVYEVGIRLVILLLSSHTATLGP